MSIKREVQQDIQLAQDGSVEAFARVIQLYERTLYGLARTYVGRNEDCADVVQDTVMKAFRAIRTLREPAYFKTWMIQILINECRQWQRKKKRSPTVELSLLQIEEKAVQEAPYEAIELTEAVWKLEHELRSVIWLHYYEDLPIKQVALRVGIPEGTVKSRLHRARMLLAEELESSQERNVGYDPTLVRKLSLTDFALLSAA
ncbi:sigma-70 family RNA polymerase sigma factor [Brevibacillus sp. BC25]|uniref:sigma-70 family RNA polymerase sigma factor n=1 Tax=Brevibacillus sp. BC25 TaxID=1144308 RepID=UPI000270E5C0|nr:sigma-70 family RNA polymerase sigma factor [Brevibacillus sp. BC25]EJL26785.1 RNA polymerase sigma factor, sigma-70 family [Brevibacillus sp. BC25]